MNRFTDFYNGNCDNAYELLGCHKVEEGVYHFAVWAPNAKAVSVVGDFNNWLVNHDNLELQDGIWQITINGARNGDCYKYAITTQSGTVIYKADPYARYSQLRPQTASVIYDEDPDFAWSDEKWMEQLAKKGVYKSPVSIYEVHAGSWRRHYDGRMYSYRDLAKYLVPYVKKMGYTHIEFMPLMEHPFDGSWGYQITGFYSPTSRYGTPDDLRYLVNQCHKNGIGVILDWVPAHFCKDAHGLMEFDGTCCYESADSYKQEHKGWGTRIFDYSRYEVQSFLISNARYWLKEFHFDGLRVDAVASMLYLDYDRRDGEWRPNKWGGKENLEAIEFFKKLSVDVFGQFPNTMLIAEESTAFPKVTHPTYTGGLGFNFKWNMGWMNDVLSYMQTDTMWRHQHHHKLTFSMCYAFSENFILPLSHDEVVHMKGSLINKMFGDYDTKFSQLKALFGFQFSHPGKKLMFMGSEIAQWNEWNENKELDWMLLAYPKHSDYQKFICELNKCYKKYKPLHQNDSDWSGFNWLLADDNKNSVISFERIDKSGNVMLVVINFSLYDYHKYGYYGTKGEYSLVLNSDDEKFGGRGIEVPNNLTVGDDGYIEITIPASSVQYYYAPKAKKVKSK
ncbi:MAG TPA: 1,4-alpha-glucan branching protein GlgB [Candidatus Limihabitans stercoravium]|nr:1,4-alpha-glucan branching protein GlgB [Candidatus Limihabitans stercoravium]